MYQESTAVPFPPLPPIPLLSSLVPVGLVHGRGAMALVHGLRGIRDEDGLIPPTRRTVKMQNLVIHLPRSMAVPVQQGGQQGGQQGVPVQQGGQQGVPVDMGEPRVAPGVHGGSGFYYTVNMGHAIPPTGKVFHGANFQNKHMINTVETFLSRNPRWVTIVNVRGDGNCFFAAVTVCANHKGRYELLNDELVADMSRVLRRDAIGALHGTMPPAVGRVLQNNIQRAQRTGQYTQGIEIPAVSKFLEINIHLVFLKQGVHIASVTTDRAITVKDFLNVLEDVSYKIGEFDDSNKSICILHHAEHYYAVVFGTA